MTTDNYIVVGDIHGAINHLQSLLDKIGQVRELKDHRLVFLGDYVDRGPDSYEAVQTIKNCVRDLDAIALLGNHEDMMLYWVDYYHGPWMLNSYQSTVKSYGDRFKSWGKGNFSRCLKQSGHYAFLKSLPLFYETEKVWFSHAPIKHDPNRGRDFRIDRHELIWSCFGNNDELVHDHGKLAICGHVHSLPGTLPRIFPKIIFADTGCGCIPTAPLTGIVVTDGKYSGHIQSH